MFSKKYKDGKRKQEEDIFDSFSYRRLDHTRFVKKNKDTIENIDDLVDSILTRRNISPSCKRFENVDKNRFFDKKHSIKKLRRYTDVRTIFGMGDRASAKKLLSILLVFVVSFAALGSAGSFVDSDLNNESAILEGMSVEGPFFSNATISDINHTNDTVDNDSFFYNHTFKSFILNTYI